MTDEPGAVARPKVTGCVIAFMEEDRIGDCLRSLSFCDEILVIDSGSDRRAPAGTRCRIAGAGRPWSTRPFPAMSRAEASSRSSRPRHDWVLCLDADERVKPTNCARRSRRSCFERDFEAPGYEVPRSGTTISGRVVQVRGLFWPDRKLRLFDRRRGLRWAAASIRTTASNSHAGLAGPTRLRGAIEHLSATGTSDHHLRHDRLASRRISARDVARPEGRRATLLGPRGPALRRCSSRA